MTDLQIETDYDAFYPGSEITVRVGWDVDPGRKPPEAVELRLVWNTAGKGDRDLKVVQACRLETAEHRGQQEVTLQLPWGPYSFSGKLISLIWALELVLFPQQSSTRKEITLSPNLSEVLIGTARDSQSI